MSKKDLSQGFDASRKEEPEKAADPPTTAPAVAPPIAASPATGQGEQDRRAGPQPSLTLDNFRQSTLFFPVVFGVIFISILLLLIVEIPQPTKFQFDIFKTILALAGAAVATMLTGTLEIFLPLPHSGFIKAGLALGVFVILFFFSPASYLVDDKKVRADNFKLQLTQPNDVQRAYSQLDTDLHARNKKGEPKFLVKADPVRLRETKAYMDYLLSDKPHHEAYKKVRDFFISVVNCIENSACDEGRTCEIFATEIERFRFIYCDWLAGDDQDFGTKDTEALRKFSMETCAPQFSRKYLEKLDNSDQICVPKKCWARNLDPPYICAVTIKAGVGFTAPSN